MKRNAEAGSRKRLRLTRLVRGVGDYGPTLMVVDPARAIMRAMNQARAARRQRPEMKVHRLVCQSHTRSRRMVRAIQARGTRMRRKPQSRMKRRVMGVSSICAASSMDFMMAPVRREPPRMTPDWRRAKMVWMRYCWRARMVVTRM